MVVKRYNLFSKQKDTQFMQDPSQFLTSFTSRVEAKNVQLNKALWLLETTGNPDAADLKCALDTEYRMLFNDTDAYKYLLESAQDASIVDPLLKRQFNVLIRQFKQHMIEPALLKEIVERESELQLAYANFRPQIEGQPFTENEIKEVLKKESRSDVRKQAWEASKQIGNLLAPQILHLVGLRNHAARNLGYTDYFTMQLDLQEVDASWLFSTFEGLAQGSDQSYSGIMEEIEQEQSRRFTVPKEELGPWAWSDPFCQEDPLDTLALDALVEGVDIPEACVNFFGRMGIDVRSILKHSDMYERAGKNQHAFCLNIDRKKDIRTLNNVTSSLKWLEVVLHEFGHAIYEMGFDPKLPWLLREPPHMVTTEAMALLAGRQAYLCTSLPQLTGTKEFALMQKAEESLRRRQLIFSRWVLTMTHFECALYRNPFQDLNALWWELVGKYQKIRSPGERKGKNDWAAKYHIGLAPAYYFSYLLGEMFASSIENVLIKKTGSKRIDTEEAGHFLQQKIFNPGNSMPWSDLIKHVTGDFLQPGPWIKQFVLS